MRSRQEIEKDPRNFDALTLEILLDIRELLRKDIPEEVKEEAPLYISDKEPKPRKKRKIKKRKAAS